MFEYLKTLFKKKKKNKVETLLYNGEDFNSNLKGRDIEYEGRKGKVIDQSLLTITVEWD